MKLKEYATIVDSDGNIYDHVGWGEYEIVGKLVNNLRKQKRLRLTTSNNSKQSKKLAGKTSLVFLYGNRKILCNPN